MLDKLDISLGAVAGRYYFNYAVKSSKNINCSIYNIVFTVKK